MFLIFKDDLKFGGQSFIIVILISVYCMFDWVFYKLMKFFYFYIINVYKYYLIDLMNLYVIIS